MEIKPLSEQINEVRTAEAFSRQSEVFDALYGGDEIIRYKRERVRQHINHYLKQGDRMLELNCGTGEDVLYFAGKGFRVHATDISGGMLEVMKRKTGGHRNDHYPGNILYHVPEIDVNKTAAQ